MHQEKEKEFMAQVAEKENSLKNKVKRSKYLERFFMECNDVSLKKSSIIRRPFYCKNLNNNKRNIIF